MSYQEETIVIKVNKSEEILPFICGICYDHFQSLVLYFEHFKMHDYDIGRHIQRSHFIKDKELVALSALQNEKYSKHKKCNFKCSVCENTFPGVCLLEEHLMIFMDEIMTSDILSDRKRNGNEDENKSGQCIVETHQEILESSHHEDVTHGPDTSDEPADGEDPHLQTNQNDQTDCCKEKTYGKEEHTDTEKNVDIESECLEYNVELSDLTMAELPLNKRTCGEKAAQTNDTSKRQMQDDNFEKLVQQTQQIDKSNDNEVAIKLSSIEIIVENKAPDRKLQRNGQVQEKKTLKDKRLLDAKIPCDVCGVLFIKKNLSRHKLKHTNAKPHQCQVCDKTKDQLYGHSLHHKREKDLICDYCGKAFNNGPNLRQHVKIHTRGKTLQCPLCPKRFRSNYILKDHITRHSDNKPCICEQCGRSFKTENEVRRHLRVHSEARPYPCQICEKAFKSRSNLIKHGKTHK